jgi:hypothetical protein
MRTLARSRDKAEILRRLRNVRPDSVGRWGRMSAHQIEWQVHPLFGGMSDGAWLRWAYLHIDHHLRQFGA